MFLSKRLSFRLNKKVLTRVLALVVLCGLLFSFTGFIHAQAVGSSTPADGNNQANAQVTPGQAEGSWEGIAKLLTYIVLAMIKLVGWFLTKFLELLIWISQYNNFIHENIVTLGWVLMRDLANIFLVVLMLMIAIGTLFNIQTYEYKSLLPKLMVAAVLINFSKTIVGAAIDFGQVIMLTFVNTFKNTGAAAIVNGLGITSMFKLANAIEGANDSINYWGVFAATGVALIMLVVASVVVIALVVMLLIRMIMLWILIIFSPFAFLASAMSGGGPLKNIGFVGNFWGMLSKYISIGPILAFLLWLSFTMMMQKDAQNKQHLVELNKKLAAGGDAAGVYAGSMQDINNIFDYLVTVALLIGALMVTQQMGVMAGGFGMKALNWTKGTSKKFGKWAAVKTGRGADKGFVKLQKKAGVKDENLISLRPSKIKAARKQHAQDKEDAFYGRMGIVGNMADRLNATFGGGKTKKGEQERISYESKRIKELVSGDEYDDKDYLISRANKILQNGPPENPDDILELKGIMDKLAMGGDLGDFLEEQGKENTRQGLKETAYELFGEKEGAKVANRLEKIAVAKGDIQFLGTTKIDLESGEARYLDLDEKDKDDDYLRIRFEDYVAAAKAKAPEERTAADKEFLRVSEQAGGNLTALSGEAREMMVDEKQAQIVAKVFSNKNPAEQVKLLTASLLAPDGKDQPGLGTLGRRVLALNSEGIVKKSKDVKPKTLSFLRNKETVEAIKELLDDKTLTRDQKENLKKFMKTFNLGAQADIDVNIDADEEAWRGKIDKLRQEADEAEKKKHDLARDGKINTPEYNKLDDEIKKKRQAADDLENKAIQQSFAELKPDNFNNPQEIAMAGAELEKAINQVLDKIENIKPGEKIDFGKMNENIEEAMKKMQETVNKNIKAGQPKPNFDLVNQRLRAQRNIKTQQAFLKQLKGLLAGLSQAAGGQKQP